MTKAMPHNAAEDVGGCQRLNRSCAWLEVEPCTLRAFAYCSQQLARAFTKNAKGVMY